MKAKKVRKLIKQRTKGLVEEIAARVLKEVLKRLDRTLPKKKVLKKKDPDGVAETMKRTRKDISDVLKKKTTKKKAVKKSVKKKVVKKPEPLNTDIE